MSPIPRPHVVVAGALALAALLIASSWRTIAMYPGPLVLAGMAGLTVALLGFLALGALVAVKRPADAAARLFCLMCFAWGSIPGMVVSIWPFASGSRFLLILPAISTIPFATLVHFCLTFPQPLPLVAARPYLRRLLYFFPAAAIVGSLAAGALREVSFWMAVPFLLLTFGAATVVSQGYPLAAIVAVMTNYRRASLDGKRQLWWMAVGFVPYFAISALLGVLVLAAGVANLPDLSSYAPYGLFVALASVGLIPASCAVAILKYRLMQVEIVIRKTILYGIVSGCVFAVYLVLSGALGGILVRVIGAQQQSVAIVSTVVAAGVFVPVKKRVDVALHRYFRRRELDYNEASCRIEESASRTSELRDLAQRVLEHLFAAMKAEMLAVVQTRPSSRIVASIGLSPEASQRLITDSGYYKRMAIGDSKEPLGWIITGPKLSRESFDADDEQLLMRAASHLVNPFKIDVLRFAQEGAEEWRRLDQWSRVVVAAVLQLSQAAGKPSIEEVQRRIATSGFNQPLERLSAVVDRLVGRGAIRKHADGRIELADPRLEYVPDLTRPLPQIAAVGAERVGAYELLDRVGAGGMGEVYRAVNVHDGSMAALKLLNVASVPSQEARRRLEREGAIVSAISHPNIVRLLSRGEHEGRFFVAMELLDGETLSTRVRRGAMTSDEVTSVARQLAEALAALHQRDVVHRDVKSSNIMLTDSGRVVLLDFGLARSAESTTITSADTVMGSLPYMAPEQLSGAVSDPRVDVWAFGIVLHEMLTRRFPWKSNNAASLPLEIASAAPDLSAVADAGQLGILMRGCLAPLPSRVRNGSDILRHLGIEPHFDQIPTMPMDRLSE